MCVVSGVARGHLGDSGALLGSAKELLLPLLPNPRFEFF